MLSFDKTLPKRRTIARCKPTNALQIFFLSFLYIIVTPTKAIFIWNYSRLSRLNHCKSLIRLSIVKLKIFGEGSSHPEKFSADALETS